MIHHSPACLNQWPVADHSGMWFRRSWHDTCTQNCFNDQGLNRQGRKIAVVVADPPLGDEDLPLPTWLHGPPRDPADGAPSITVKYGSSITVYVLAPDATEFTLYIRKDQP